MAPGRPGQVAPRCSSGFYHLPSPPPRPILPCGLRFQGAVLFCLLCAARTQHLRKSGGLQNSRNWFQGSEQGPGFTHEAGRKGDRPGAQTACGCLGGGGGVQGGCESASPAAGRGVTSPGGLFMATLAQHGHLFP